MHRRPLHICIVTADFPGLTETFITNKVLQLRQRGHRITVIKNSDHGAINKSHLALVKNAGIEIMRMNSLSSLSDLAKIAIHRPSVFATSISSSSQHFKRSIKSKLQVLLLSKHRFDIIHFEFSGLAVSYLGAIKKLETKTVVSCRGTAEKVKPLTDAKRKGDLVKLFTSVNALHCVSADMAKTIASYGADERKIFVNRPAVDASVFKRTTEYTNSNILHILTIGRLTFQKGYLLGLMAMKELKDKGVQFKWSIVGDGPLLEEITFHIHSLGLTGYVEVLGKKSHHEIIDLYNNIDIFLLPSVYEGIANVCLEAMAMELPVVSTRSGGMEEVIVAGQNGLLCNTYSAADIAFKIESIANDFELRKQLGCNGRKTVLENFTLEKQVDTFEKEYYQLVYN